MSSRSRRSVFGFLRKSCCLNDTKLVQRIFPTNFSNEIDSNSNEKAQERTKVFLHVYRLKDGQFGFYHTGIQFGDFEYTYCYEAGIVKHEPYDCEWAEHVGDVYLGISSLSAIEFEDLVIKEMSRDGFSISDYDVMDRSCNTFTHCVATRLGLEERYPSSVFKQSKIGEILSPVVHFFASSSSALPTAAKDSKPPDDHKEYGEDFTDCFSSFNF